MQHKKYDFWRTISFIDFLQNNLNLIDKDSIIPRDFNSNQEFQNFLENQSSLGHRVKDLLEEIYHLEHTKRRLKGDRDRIVAIRSFELDIYTRRDLLLSSGFENTFEKKFVVHPLVKLLKLSADWMTEDVHNKSNKFKEFTTSNSDDFYIGFLETGSLDGVLDSNVIEYKLNEYEYFLLNQTVESSTMLSIIQALENEFEPNSQAEKIELRKNATTILRRLIYKTLLIETEASTANTFSS